MNAVTDTTLESVLNKFALSVNNNGNIQSITKNWNLIIFIACLDEDECYSLSIREGVIENIDRCEEPDEIRGDHEIMLRSVIPCFIDVFTGKRNPALASLEGELEVYGNENHSVKLDAITLILWGF